MNWRTQGPSIAWVLALIFILWVLYLLYKIAHHVGAWPFG